MSKHYPETSAECGLDEKRRKLMHDVQECLHVIHIGIGILQDVRGDDARFAEVSETIEKERKKATELVKQLSDLAHE